MAYTPENSAIKVTPELEERLANVSMEEMKSILAEEAVRTGLVTRDRYDASVLIPNEQPVPKRFAKTIMVGGEKQIVEGDSEREVDLKTIEIYKAAQSQPQQPSQTPPAAQTQTRDDQGRFARTEQQQVADQAELSLKFRRGEINVDQYIAQSGALDRYLADKGVSVEAMVEISNRHYSNDWASATDQFLKSPQGAGWPGGAENLKIIGDELIALGLDSAEDKFAAICQAYEKLKADDRLVATPVQEFARGISEATSHADIARLSKGLYGR